jgi:5-keto 4-deoxyuronate isomerase
MPAGFKYDLKSIEANMPEMCRYETVYRYSGGFNLVLDNLTGVDKIPPMAPLVLDFVKRRATAVINVDVVENISEGAISLKIKKNSLAYIGMHLSNGTNGGTIASIDKTSNAEYDTVTLAASPTLIAKKGDTLFEVTTAEGKTPKATATALNYAWTKVEEGATVTAIGQAYEIRPTKLIVPISEKDKASLGDRFMFTY